MMRKSGTETDDRPPTRRQRRRQPPTIPAPAGRLPRRFQDHYGKAQAFMSRPTRPPRGRRKRPLLPRCPTTRVGWRNGDASMRMPEPGAPAHRVSRMERPLQAASDETCGSTAADLRVSARPGEPEKERATREKTARGQLEEGRKALDDRQFDAAITALQSAISTSGRSDYGVQAE